MSVNLPIRSPPTSASRRNQDSRNYFTSYTSGGAEAINGPVREEARKSSGVGDRLIVGVDFGTTFSGCVPPLGLRGPSPP